MTILFQLKKWATVEGFWAAALSCTKWISLRHVLGRIFSNFSPHFLKGIFIEVSRHTHAFGDSMLDEWIIIYRKTISYNNFFAVNVLLSILEFLIYKSVNFPFRLIK